MGQIEHTRLSLALGETDALTRQEVVAGYTKVEKAKDRRLVASERDGILRTDTIEHADGRVETRVYAGRRLVDVRFSFAKVTVQRVPGRVFAERLA